MNGEFYMSSVADVITDNFLLIFLSLLFSIVIIILLRVLMVYLEGRRLKIKAQYEMDMVKLEIARKKALMEELRNSTVVLTDRERQRLEAVKVDNSILTRKLIADMNEIEERIKRSELGSDSVRTSQILGLIKSYENRLFEDGKK
jgi:biopolymer transport protein ExbB/TolQ